MSKFILVLMMFPVFGFGQTQSDYPRSVLKNRNIKPLPDTSGNFVDSSSRHLLTVYLIEKGLNLHYCFTDRSYSDKTRSNLIYVNVWSLDNAEDGEGKKKSKHNNDSMTYLGIFTIDKNLNKIIDVNLGQ